MANARAESGQTISTDVKDSEEIDVLVSGWADTLPSDPYVVSVPSDVPYNRPSAQKDNWKLETFWDSDEEYLQYLSCVWRDPWNTLFAVRTLSDFHQDQTPLIESNSATDRSGRSTPVLRGMKKKINFRDYKARLARAEASENLSPVPNSALQTASSPALSIHVTTPTKAAVALNDHPNHSSPFSGSSPPVTQSSKREPETVPIGLNDPHNISRESNTQLESATEEKTPQQNVSKSAKTKPASKKAKEHTQDVMQNAIPWIFSGAGHPRAVLLESNLTLENILNLPHTPNSDAMKHDRPEPSSFGIALPSTPPTSKTNSTVTNLQNGAKVESAEPDIKNLKNEYNVVEDSKEDSRTQVTSKDPATKFRRKRKHSSETANDDDDRLHVPVAEHGKRTVPPVRHTVGQELSIVTQDRGVITIEKKDENAAQNTNSTNESTTLKPRQETSSKLRQEFKTLHSTGRQLKHAFQAQAAETLPADKSVDEAAGLRARLLVAVQSLECLLCFMAAYTTQDQYAPNWEAWWSLNGLSQVITKCCQHADPHLHGLCLALRALIYERVVRTALHSEFRKEAEDSEKCVNKSTQATILQALSHSEHCSELSRSIFSLKDLTESYPQLVASDGSLAIGAVANSVQMITLSMALLRVWAHKHQLDDAWQPKLSTELCSILRSTNT